MPQDLDLFGEPIVEDAPEPDMQEDVAAPEAIEEEGGLQPPQTSDFFIGHEDVEKDILQRYDSGRLAHGLVFEGVKGIGKATFAFRFLRKLLGDNEAAKKLINGGGHPDVRYLERQENTTGRLKDIDVAQIRSLGPFLAHTASMGGWRCVIIDDADTMARAAQNALLKTLEEPPANSLIILITHKLGALLPTIRSRTQLVHFDALNREAFNTVLQNSDYSPSEEDLRFLYTYSKGSPGAALALLETDGLETFGTLMEVMQDVVENGHTLKAFHLGDQLQPAGQAQAFEVFQTLLMWVMQTLVFEKAAHGTSKTFKGTFLQDVAEATPLPDMIGLHDDLRALFTSCAQSHLDKRTVILQLFQKIQIVLRSI